MTQIVMKETLQKKREKAAFAPGTDLRNEVAIYERKGETIGEFIGNGDFAQAFIERQRYEVDSGRLEEPILFDQIYAVNRSADFPKIIPIDVLGPAGLVFEKVLEGGEVKFGTVGSSSKSVELYHYAVGLEYHRDIFEYNMTWRLAPIEREVGTAFNALMNHIHFNPILAYSYAAANQTAASAVGATLEEKYLRTLEDAINNSEADTANPRFGPYALIISNSNRFMVERMLNRVPQEGFGLQSSALDLVSRVVVYKGWTGTRGKLTFTYSGVTAGKAYLVSLAKQDIDFQSYIKNDLGRMDGDKDMSRFIIGSDIWDTDFGVYSNPIAAVEEITWPT